MSSETLPDIDGLQYIPDYITKRQEQGLIQKIDSLPWSHELKRRVQQYGSSYRYRGNKSKKNSAEPFQEWMRRLARKLQQDEFFSETPDQLIINEYFPGTGIAPHVDQEELFGETIVSLSLLSAYQMEFIKKSTRQRCRVLLKPRSALVLSGESRHDWLHGISPRTTDRIDGKNVLRGRRISLTFRTRKED